MIFDELVFSLWAIWLPDENKLDRSNRTVKASSGSYKVSVFVLKFVGVDG
jgi:hypothetical protein